jgi:hypothetical protein
MSAAQADLDRYAEKLMVDEILSRWDGEAHLAVREKQIILYTNQGEELCASERMGDILECLQEWDAVLARDADSGAINGACTTKSPARARGRPLNPKVTDRRNRVAEMAEELQPATIRQVCYQAEVRGLIPKTELGFRRAQHDLLILRQQGIVEYDWISDNTRWMRKSPCYRGIKHFINLTINTYRRDLWHTAAHYVEIWIEKDALAGTVMDVTDPYDVPLMVARGFSSETHLYEAAMAIRA